MSLARQVLVLIYRTLVLDLGRGSLKLACIIGLIQASFFLPECFFHLIERGMNLLVILNILPPGPLFLHLFPVLSFLHLLEQLILVGLFFLFSLVELSFGNVFKHVARLHMHDFLLFGRVSGRKHRLAQFGLRLRRCRTELMTVGRVLGRGLLLLLLLLLLLVRQLFDPAIMLRLAREGVVLRDDLAVTVPDGRATTLPEGAKVIVVRIVVHVAHVLIGLLLLYQPFLFIFLVDLGFEHGLVISLLLLSF